MLASIIATLVMVEIGAWFWVSHLRPQYLSQWEFRATQPPPYRDAEYFGAQFLKEAEASVSGRVSNVVELNDFHGRYFNIEGGFRVMTDTPPAAERRVLLFGGSTMFGQEVPDAHTIASYLQRMLNASGVRWEVRNFGLPGMNAAQQTLILKRVRLQPDDIVIFYHGVNDIYYLVFGGHAHGWMRGVPAFRPVQKLSRLHKWLHAWHERLKDYSYTAQVALDIYRRGVPETVSDPEELARGLTNAEAQFRAAVMEAAGISRTAGATFVHFLQPTVFSSTSLTPYERQILQNPLGTAPGVADAFRVGYPGLRRVGKELQAEGIDFFDVSDALDNRVAGEEVFLDFCHVNHVGNRLIAQRMMDVFFRDPRSR